ncbi:exopolysaccharide biosynthesis polyprenyl glycosylphosphotransferase [Archangium primigenium]|uniref:exopolysaccharide biosynthesis polyprenyl glycosylphosphotransferase n=1 Tax=[Archangium] primigenium TaxID=2792470 RepID=UPI00195ADF6C|nr:sugar transferase [Archangium primigenium]
MSTPVPPLGKLTASGRFAAVKSLWLVPPRVILQRRASRTLLMHAIRATARVVLLVAADIAAFVLARAAVNALQTSHRLEPIDAATRWAVPPLGSAGGWQMGAALVVGLIVAGAYHSGDAWRSPRRILSGVLLAVGLVLWRDLWVRGLAPVVVHYLTAVVGLGIAMLLARGALDRLIGRLIRIPLFHSPAERVVLVGDPDAPDCRRVHARLTHFGVLDTVGWISLGAPEGLDPRPGVLGTLDDLWNVLQHNAVDTVVLCGTVDDAQLKLMLEAVESAGVRLLAASRYERLGWVRPSPISYRSQPFMELTLPSLRAQQLWVKRGVDLLGAGLGLVLISPLLAFIALAIKLDSSGPVFFAQERVGRGGRTFRMMKFRTMRVGADAEKAKLAHLNTSGDARLFKIPNDPRVTRVGTFLRKWSLDELPQLFNVLRGDMSVVGPRPFFESDLATYRDHHFGRLGARPGITGLWQVSGRSSITDFEEVVRLDCEYIHRWSLWLDLEILFKTLPAVLRRTGAY